MRGIAYPESLAEIYNWQISEARESPNRSRDLERLLVSDGSLVVLTSNSTNNFQIKFLTCWDLDYIDISKFLIFTEF